MAIENKTTTTSVPSTLTRILNSFGWGLHNIPKKDLENSKKRRNLENHKIKDYANSNYTEAILRNQTRMI